MTKGKFITLEGCEGVGKSTNLEFIRAYLEAHNIPLIMTREPGGTALAEKIRGLLLESHTESVSEQAELLLMFAARSQHLKHVIRPALAVGTWVLCDRFTDATYAYQGGGRRMDIKTIEWLERLVQGTLKPDLTLLLDAPVDIGLKRAEQRGELDRFEQEKLHFFENVRRAYLLQAELNPRRIKVVNANQPLVDVQQSIIKLLQRFMP
ncbi:MAG: dTMP kinase [Methylococcales bacterium]